jgi:hypothetical protein
MGKVREQKRKLTVQAGRLFGVLEELSTGGLVTAGRCCGRLTGGVKQQKDGSQGRKRGILIDADFNQFVANVYGWLFLTKANASASIMNGGPLAQ